ncbi:hypothetical protein RSAG8_12265, partial [Rhizoctonia solani AG-8 WAC10335]
MSSDLSRPSSPDSSETELEDVYDERKPIDRNLPPISQVTLGQDTFALTGHFTDPETGLRRRAEIDLSSYRPKPTDALHQISDIDSVIGVMFGRVPLLPGTIIKYHMILSPSHTLRTDLHIPPIKIQRWDGTTANQHLHKVPNMRIFELEPRGTIRIHFPHEEAAEGGKVCLDEEHARQFYDKCLYPAAVATLPEDLVREWPPSYVDEKFRGKKKKDKSDLNQEQRGGTTQQSGRDIHTAYLNDLLAKARELVESEPELRWAQHFFLGFEMRGMKNREVSLHPPPEDVLVDADGMVDDEAPRVKAVDAVLDYFDTSQFEKDCWFLDIATRVVVSDDVDEPSACTFASADMHAHLLNHFTELDWERCVEYTNAPGKRYQKDEVAQFNNIAGGRFTNPDGVHNGVHFVQIYTTDKSVTYNLELANNAQRSSSAQLANSWDKELEQHIDPLLRAFKNSSQTHGVALRIESRVEFFNYPLRHLRIPDDLLERCLFRIDRHEFWGWKVARLTSIRSLLCEWMAARKTFTSDQLPEAGTMLHILAFMMNALVNRPDSGSNWDQVHDAACVHIMKAGQLVPDRPLGSLFLPQIHFRLNRQPRVSSQRTLPIKTICYLLGARNKLVTESDVFNMFTRFGDKQKRCLEGTSSGDEGNIRSRAAPRFANKQRRVLIMSSERPEDQFAHIMPRTGREEYSSEDEDPEERESARQPSQHLTDLVHSYPIQIMAKAPNKASSSDSWCSLTPKERAELKFDFFSSKDRLHQAFKVRIDFPIDNNKWEKTIALLFPDLDNQSEKHDQKFQGLSTLKVRDDFIQIQRAIPEGSRAVIVKSVRDFVSAHWVWLPYCAGKGHLWASGTEGAPKSATKVGESADGTKGGPWIVLNPAFAD